jgi:KUP system potassium uptake protein
MPVWRENLFIATSRLSTDGVEFFCLPQDRTLIEGSRIEVWHYFDLLKPAREP